MSVSHETRSDGLSLDELSTLIGVSRETSSRLAAYADLLLHWNRAINLIGRADEERLARRHIFDALQMMSLVIGRPAYATDLGSGAGFPGLILAIATGIHFHLVESDVRKAAFLREAAREVKAPVTVHSGRIETTRILPSALVTARALAPLPKLLCLTIPFLAPGGICLFPKGKGVDAELTEAAMQWNMKVERFPSQVDSSGTILRISEVARV
jgi:16S rRNA (guanine(527)-N(7))-methyltransferase RsmG